MRTTHAYMKFATITFLLLHKKRTLSSSGSSKRFKDSSNDTRTQPQKRILSTASPPKRFKDSSNDTEIQLQQRSPPSTPGIMFGKESVVKQLPKFDEIIDEPIVISDESSSDESEPSSPENSRQKSEILKILVDTNSIWASPSVTNISDFRLKAAIDSILIKEPDVPEHEEPQVYFYGFSQRMASIQEYSMKSINDRPESVKEHKRKDNNNIDDLVYEDIEDDKNNVL